MASISGSTSGSASVAESVSPLPLPTQDAQPQQEVGAGGENPPPTETSQSQLPQKRKMKKRTSVVWDHFTKIEGIIPPRAKCNYCSKNYACDTTTVGNSPLTKHMNRCENNQLNKLDKERRQSTLSFKSKTESGDHDLVAVSFSVEACRKALAEMIIRDEHSFSLVEGEGFKRFIAIGMPRFYTHLPSRVTVARDCLKVYVEEKKKLKNMLRGRRVCITTDTWTSIQNLSYMCLTGHFIDDGWHLHKRILNFCQVPNHKGETLGKIIETCLLNWGVGNIYTVTVDNASSNNGAIDWLKRKTMHKQKAVLDHDFLHMRCSAHILNLIVGDGLKESNMSVVMVRNAIKYVRSSPSRFDAFKKCVRLAQLDKHKSLVCLDVQTRWNSTYLMLEAAEKYEKAFDRLEEDDREYQDHFAELDKEGRQKHLGPPIPHNWHECRILVKFLKCFYVATLRFSGSSYVTSNSFFIEIAMIQSQLLQLSKSQDLQLRHMVSRMILKFQKYWDVKKMNQLLLVALVLDPRYKMRYLEFTFSKLWEFDAATVGEITKQVKTTLMDLYNWYAANECGGSQVFSCGTSSSVVDEYDDASDDDCVNAFKSHAILFKRHLQTTKAVTSKSEVDKYIDEDLEVDENFVILDWWKAHSSRFPILSRVARDILVVPTTSVASESAFSTGGRLLDPFRSCLAPKTVEALICAQDWLRNPYQAINLRASMDMVEESHLLEEDFFALDISSD